MHRDLVLFGHQKIDGLPCIGEALELRDKIITECVASVDVRLTKSAAVAHKVRRNQLVKPLLILEINHINKLSDQFFVRFYCHAKLIRDRFALLSPRTEAQHTFPSMVQL
jgi:hypothetical protein